jgi:hypothetical protein
LYFDFASNFGISSMVIARGGTGSGSSSMVLGFGQVAKARSRLGDALRTRECCRSGEGGSQKTFFDVSEAEVGEAGAAKVWKKLSTQRKVTSEPRRAAPLGRDQG